MSQSSASRRRSSGRAIAFLVRSVGWSRRRITFGARRTSCTRNGGSPMRWIRAARLIVTLALALPAAACAAAHPPKASGPAPAAATGLVLERVVTGLDQPLYLTAPAGDPLLFVVEQPGRIRIIKGGKLLPRPFLDLTDRVRSGGERGLLSVAFHPRYASNGFLYVNYTDLHGDTHVERYTVTSDPDVADPNSAHLVLHIDQPFANHNGGLVMFGLDGMLYVGMGDGGSGGDP